MSNRKTPAAYEAEIIDLIIESLNLNFVDRNTIDSRTELMVGGLGLDSVDVLEVVVAIEHRYQFKIKDAEQGKKIFQSIGSIANFVAQHQNIGPNQLQAPAVEF